MHQNDSYIFAPYDDMKIDEEVRLVIYDNLKKKYVHIKTIEPFSIYELRFISLDNHLNCKYKYQIKKTIGSQTKWVDTPSGYNYLIPETVDETGLTYAFYPSRKKSDYLIVGFSGIQFQPKYNYIKTLDGLSANRLYIKDCYGKDKQTQTSYYLNEKNDIKVSDLVQELIRKYAIKLNISNDKIILIGSSKGGYAALYHGYEFGVGCIIVGGPQILLGDYLFNRKDEVFGPAIFKGIFGELNERNRVYANNLLFKQIKKSSLTYPNIYVHVGEGDPHYLNHVVPFIRYTKSLGINNVHLDLGDYNTHARLASYFSAFLKETVKKIVNSGI